MTKFDHFNLIRGRFSYRHLLLFSVSIVLVFFTYRPYGKQFSSIMVEYDANNDTDHLSNNECGPKKKIVFMKTHKCASSTIENILFRHAVREELNIALPWDGNYLSRSELFNRSSVLSTKWGKLPVDLFTLHNRWNYEETMALMGPSAFTFTIVRNPVNQFESLYVYMGLDSLYRMDMKNFIQAVQNKTNVTKSSLRSGGMFGRNQMAFDLGISIAEFDSEPQIIYDRIKQLDNQFQLVMIAERMEESLVLLADLLCWPLERVVYLVLNVRKPEKNVKLTEDERHILARWLNVDSAIYSYFKQRFDERIADFNARNKPNWMDEQVRLLRDLNYNLKDRCVIEQVGNEKLTGKFLETSNNIMGYLVHEDLPECELYAMSEPAYLTLFRKRMDEQLASLNPGNKSSTILT